MVPTPTLLADALRKCRAVVAAYGRCAVLLRHAPQSTYAFENWNGSRRLTPSPLLLPAPPAAPVGGGGLDLFSHKGGELVVRNFQLTLMSKCQSGLISAESPETLVEDEGADREREEQSHFGATSRLVT